MRVEGEQRGNCIQGHGHVHDHACGCSHNHAHEPDHSDGNSVDRLSVSTVDGAVVGSYSCTIIGEYDEALEDLKQRLALLARSISQAGGIIGHIKCTAHEQARSCVVSVTDVEDMQIKQADYPQLLVSGAAIAFCVSEAQMRAFLQEAFPKQ